MAEATEEAHHELVPWLAWTAACIAPWKTAKQDD